MAVVLLVLVWLAPVAKLPRNVRWVLVAAALLLVFTGLQSIPLPAAVVHTLAPANADIWARSLTPLGEMGPRFHPISVAPPMTTLQLLRGLVYLSVFLATIRLVAADLGAFVERVIVLSTALMGMLALAHPAIGAEKVLGVYRPRNLYAFTANYYAPILNPNHLAAYLNIGACIALASLISNRPLFPRPLIGALTLFLTGTSIWAGSRGGMGALALGIVVIGLLNFWAKSQRSHRGGQFAVAALIGVASAVLIGFASSDAARSEVANADLGKLNLAATAFRVVSDAPWFGFGRGGFEDVFSRVRLDTHYVTYTNPENIVAQWTSEWGVPVSVAAAGLLVWALRPESVLSSARPAIGAWTAIVVSGVHDLVDFHLEVPGVMITVAACAALVLGRRSAVHVGRQQVPQRGVFLVAAATCCAALVVLLSSGDSLADDRERMSKLAVDPSTAAPAFRDEARAMMLRHPAEPFLPLMGAVRAQVFGEGSVVSWAASALERYPRFGRAHLVIARSLGARHPSQARLEYRLAYEYDVGLREEVISEGSNLVSDTSSALELVVHGADRAQALELLSVRLSKRLPSTAFSLDAELLGLGAMSDTVLTRRAADAVSDLANRHPWCAVEDCGAVAVRATEANLRAHPDQCAAHLLNARAIVGATPGDTARRRAVDELIRALDEVADRTHCQRSALEVMQELGDERYIDPMLHALVGGDCGRSGDCVELYVWAAQFEERRRREVTALTYYKRVYDIDHDREDALEAIVRLGTKHELLGDASMAADALARRHPEDARRTSTATALAERLRGQRFSGSRKSLPKAGGEAE